jgi:hypothetical protein
MTPDQEQEIVRLRSLNLTPKQIARQLALRPAEVTAFIRGQAQASQLIRAATGELAPLHHCLINESVAQQLLAHPKTNRNLLESLKPMHESNDAQGMGLAQVFVTRVERGTYFVCSYLVDYWCLGVKSTFGPRKMDAIKYESMIQKAYRSTAESYREITLEQAQSVIFGALDYADNLGLKPDPDFERSKVHLGERPEKLMEIEFGKDGKPFYVDGPHDRPAKIIETLEKSVGKGNFHYLVQPDAFLGPSDRLFR